MDNKTYVVVLNYGTTAVYLYAFDGDLTTEQVEDKLSVWHKMADCYYMCASQPIDIYKGNYQNITPNYE